MSDPKLTQRNAYALHHRIADHEVARWLQTGDPIRTLCGCTIPASRYRETYCTYSPLPECPDCRGTVSTKAGDLAA
jgi:hypothetical protein